MRGLTDIQRAASLLLFVKMSFGCKKDSFATRPKNISRSLERFAEIQERLSRVIIEK